MSSEGFDATSLKESLFLSEEGVPLTKKLKILFSNKCYVYLVIASFFRFFGGYALGFLGSTFFDFRYPDNIN